MISDFNDWRMEDNEGKTLEERIIEWRKPWREFRRFLLENGCTAYELAWYTYLFRYHVNRCAHLWCAARIIPPKGYQWDPEVLARFHKPVCEQTT